MRNIAEKHGINNNTIIASSVNLAINSPSAVVGSRIKMQFPSTIDDKLFIQTLEVLDEFLVSKQSEDMKNKDVCALQAEITESRKLGYKNGWVRLRDYLSDSANLVTIATPLVAYLTGHPEIPQAILSWFWL